MCPVVYGVSHRPSFFRVQWSFEDCWCPQSRSRYLSSSETVISNDLPAARNTAPHHLMAPVRCLSRPQRLSLSVSLYCWLRDATARLTVSSTGRRDMDGLKRLNTICSGAIFGTASGERFQSLTRRLFRDCQSHRRILYTSCPSLSQGVYLIRSLMLH